jgi:hypothetical protein
LRAQVSMAQVRQEEKMKGIKLIELTGKEIRRK